MTDPTIAEFLEKACVLDEDLKNIELVKTLLVYMAEDACDGEGEESAVDWLDCMMQSARDGLDNG
jgi:hypothetical protein